MLLDSGSLVLGDGRRLLPQACAASELLAFGFC